jgi:hypothetical protein
MSDDDLLRGAEELEWEEEMDLTSISEEEIRGLLKELAEEERAISYRRRIIQGRIDLIRAEHVRCGGVVLSSEELARVLIQGGEEGRAESPGSIPEPLSGRGGDL